MCEPAFFTALGMSAANAATAASVATTVGTIASVGGTVLSAVGAYNQSQATKDQAAYQAAVADNNAIIAERNARGIEKRGKRAAAQQRLKTRQLQSRQAVGLAGQGGDITDEGEVNLLAESGALGELDAQMIRTNAERDAYNARVQGQGFTNQSIMHTATADAQNPLLEAGGTVLTGFGQVASQWYK